jgi:hypothetical protein
MLQKITQEYRDIVGSSLKASNLTLRCTELSATCSNYFDNKNANIPFQIGGEDMYSLIRALFVMSCDMLAQLPNIPKTSTEYQTVCQHQEALATSSYDIHYYLLHKGLKAYAPWLGFGASAFCTNMDEGINLAVQEMAKLDKQELADPQVNEHYKTKPLASDSITFSSQNLSMFLATISKYSTVYKAFATFLLDKENRRVAYETLRTQMSYARLNPVQEARLWLQMYAVACVMIMANLCQDVTGFTVEHIQEVLSAPYQADHNPTFVYDDSDMDTQQQQQKASWSTRLKDILLNASG